MKIIMVNKKIIYIIIIAIILTTIFTLFLLKKKENVEETLYSPLMNKVILIDAGHGGFDPGAIGTIKNEDTLNLEIALRLRRLIEQSGGVVLLTREDENGLNDTDKTSIRNKKNEDMRNRRILIEESKPEIFISLHVNSFPQSRYYGAQTFYKGGSEESKILAKYIQDEFREVLDKENNRRPQLRNNVYLIKKAEKVAVLIEVGFISNPNEEKLLNDEVYQEKVAWSIYIGLLKYYNYASKNM